MSDYQWSNDIFRCGMQYYSLERLEESIKEARKAEANGAWKDFHLKAQYEDGCIVDIFLTGERKETDNEYLERKKYEQALLEHQKKIRRETYEKLKKEFEGQ